jgi:hypothetical protein
VHQVRGMKRTVLTACLLAAACGAASDDPEADLPGDIDNLPAGNTPKGDEWDYVNDPMYMAHSLQYKLSDLPKTGKLEEPAWKERYPAYVGKAPVAWADTYWPSLHGSTNARWQGSAIKSPLEKYDQAFNAAPGCETRPQAMCGEGAKDGWNEYRACAGPAAKWQLDYQGISKMFDGVDNDGDGQTDECDSSDQEGPQGWWGLCHAWSPAALLEPEPQHAVSLNGVTFEVGDIKALILTYYDKNSAVMLGGRCNAESFTPDNTTSANDTCADSNPGAMHVVLTNSLGIHDQAVVMDRTASSEVWNQPIVGYQVTRQDKVDASRAMSCVGASGATYTYNRNAKELYEVQLKIDFLVEGDASTRPLGMDDYVSSETYHYILELGAAGKVIGGRYCADSEGPDFLWAPRGASSGGGRNPHIDFAKIKQLIDLSMQPGTAPSHDGPSYENRTGAAIPDNSAAGASLDISVPDSFVFTSVTVAAEIEHPYIGDLVVELHRDGTRVATLQENSGGGEDNLNLTTTLTAAQVGGDAAKATWTLKAIDNQPQDAGRIVSFKLTFAR